MASISRDRDRDRLEQGLRTDEYQKLLRSLQRGRPFLRQFTTWTDVLMFMHNGTSRDPRKDEILRPIFQAHSRDEDPRWRVVLLAIFWPGLESIHYQKRHWDANPDERWQNVIWTFLKVLCRVDVERRPDRLVQKVFNDTVHHLHHEYRRVWNRTSREFTADPGKIEALAGGVDGIDFEGIYLREEHVREVNRLQVHLDAGRITEANFLLLVITRLYGKTIAGFAREAGLAYQRVRKRRWRCEGMIRRFEEGDQ